MSEARARKLADRIRVLVAKLLESRIKDPRLGFVTVTDVRVTGDLQHASVFYTVLGTDEEREQTAQALASATGMIRSEVGRNLGIRLTPSIEFIADAIPQSASRIEDLLAHVHEEDEQIARVAASAAYAGEADPYRKPADEDEDDDDADLTPGQGSPDGPAAGDGARRD